MTTRTLHCAPGVPTVYRQVVPQYQPVQTAVQQPGVAIVYGQATPQYQYQPVQATVPGQQPVPIVYGQATPQGYHPVPVIVTQQPAAVARQEQWYSDGLFGRNYNIAQPDPGRMVLSGSRSRYGFVRYTYADQLPCLISCFITCAAIMVILGTPLSLICSIPAVIQLKKAREAANEGDIQAARIRYKYAQWLLVPVCFSIALTAIIAGVAAGQS